MIFTSQVDYNMAGQTHKAMPWQPPTQSLKNVSGWDNDQYNPLPKFEPLLYSLIVDLVVFCFEYKNYSPLNKQNLLFYHPLKKVMLLMWG